jgi:hypothetical protein
MQNKKARAEARNAFPTNYNQQSMAKKKFLRRDINAICTTVGLHLNKQGYKAPDHRDPVRSMLVLNLLEKALRDNSEDPKGFCPECNKWHTFPGVTAPCPKNPDHQPVNLVDWNPKNDANSIQAAMKMMDKLFPNLAAVSGTINVEGTITTVSAELIKVIIEYVPAEKRNECFGRIDVMLANLQQTGVES